MNNPFIILAISFLTLNSIIAQKKIQPSKEDLLTAKNLKEDFPDDPIALELSKDYVSFGYNKKTHKVTATHNLEEQMINLDSRSEIQKYQFYNSESEITEFKIYKKNKKRAVYYLKDEAFASDDLFHHDTRVKYTNIKFPLKGFKYLVNITKQYKDIKYFTSLYFNSNFPTLNKEIIVEVPNWLDLELKEINFEGYDISKNVTKNDKKQSTIYSYTLKKIPATYKEDHSPGPTYIYPHLLILAKSYNQNKQKENIFNTTQDLYNWYHSLVKSLKNEDTPFKEKVAELVKDCKTDEEKIKSIYYWVQDNIRYIAFEDGIAGFKPDEAANVYNKKYGDCKGMANLIKQMLIEIGFDARLTWIGTKRIAYDYSIPNLAVDNHMICSVFLDDKVIFLDGTEKYNALGEYANRIQGKEVLIEDGPGFLLNKIPEESENHNKEVINYEFQLENNLIKGKATKTFKGESRSTILHTLNNQKNDEKEESLKRYLSNGNSNIKIKNIETSDLSNRDIDLNLSYDLDLNNAVSEFDNQIYLEIDFDKELKDFDLSKRKTDYVFSFKRHLESTTIINMPKHLKVKFLPENLAVNTKNYSINITFTQKDNSIIYKKQLTINNAKIPTSDFKHWNNTIAQLKNIYNQQIVLSK